MKRAVKFSAHPKDSHKFYVWTDFGKRHGLLTCQFINDNATSNKSGENINRLILTTNLILFFKGFAIFKMM